ncbi:MAG: hypothetical protein P1P89_08640 [Desulfobacterales bacterium]|nr:hypothetical protein [Desulfobacterales bacterium]
MNLVEQIGSGIQRIFDICREYGVAKPKFEISEDWVTVVFPRLPGRVIRKVTDQVTDQVADQVTDQVLKLLKILEGTEAGSLWVMEQLKLSHRPTFRKNYLHPAVESGLIEMTIPDKPRSSKQRYRLTAKGRDFLEKQGGNQ